MTAEGAADIVGPAGMRRRYTAGELDESELAADPMDQLEIWLAAAQAYGIVEPNAMVLATASRAAVPSVRTVLLKGLDPGGLVFYTNHASAKGADLAENPQGEVLFGWYPMERQVRAAGAVVRLPPADSASYFASRPRESQLGAWASEQSRPIGSRAELDARYTEVERRFSGREVPLPDFWGGYRLRPERVEFWQGRTGRLHDRVVYERDDGQWRRARLQP